MKDPALLKDPSHWSKALEESLTKKGGGSQAWDRGNLEPRTFQDNGALLPALDKESVISGESIIVPLSTVGHSPGLQWSFSLWVQLIVPPASVAWAEVKLQMCACWKCLGNGDNNKQTNKTYCFEMFCNSCAPYRTDFLLAWIQEHLLGPPG